MEILIGTRSLEYNTPYSHGAEMLLHPPVLSGDHQSLVFCVVFCSPLFVLIVFVLFSLAIVLFVLSLMASD
jgi:hypothetical protein